MYLKRTNFNYPLKSYLKIDFMINDRLYFAYWEDPIKTHY